MTTNNEIRQLAQQRRHEVLRSAGAWILGGSNDGAVLGLETIVTNLGVSLVYGPAAIGRHAVNALQALGQVDANYLLASSNQVTQVEE